MCAYACVLCVGLGGVCLTFHCGCSSPSHLFVVCMRVMCEIERWYFIGAEIAREGRTKDGSLWDPKQAKQTKQT